MLTKIFKINKVLCKNMKDNEITNKCYIVIIFNFNEMEFRIRNYSILISC